jgi:hypothetical protein
LCRENNIGGRAATHSSTAPVLNWFVEQPHGLNDRAIPFNNAVFEYTIRYNIRTVLLVSSWWYVKDSSEGMDALLDTVAALRKADVNVFVMRTVPTYDFDVAKTILNRKFNGRNLTGVGLSVDAYQGQYPFPDGGESLKDAGAIILDPADIMIADGSCRLYDVGGAYYSDSNHLSEYGALALVPLFHAVFETTSPSVLAKPPKY